MTKQNNPSPTATMLTICVGFLVIFMITDAPWALYVSLVIGLIGVFSDFLSQKITWFWMQLARVLSHIVPNILLTIVFFGILLPLAWLSRISNKDALMLKRRSASLFRDKNSTFEPSSFEKPW